jgi:hypothetical protein
MALDVRGHEPALWIHEDAVAPGVVERATSAGLAARTPTLGR